MKKSELKALILECKQELAEEAEQKEISLEEVDADAGLLNATIQQLSDMASKYRGGYNKNDEKSKTAIVEKLYEGVDKEIIDTLADAISNVQLFQQELVTIMIETKQ
jgi:hypothetical protein